ncbi:tyrosine/serine/threonine protein phosphatase pps1, partial [Ascosphaera atra]
MSTALVHSRSPSPAGSERSMASVTLSSESHPSRTSSPRPEASSALARLRISGVETETDERRPFSPIAEEDEQQEQQEPKLYLYPPHAFTQMIRGPIVYRIDADQLAAALRTLAKTPLKPTNEMFPWLHAACPVYSRHVRKEVDLENYHPVPQGLRSILLVKAGKDYNRSKLKGSVAPEEIVEEDQNGCKFRSIGETNEGRQRRFKAQLQKFARVSDIVVYADDDLRKIMKEIVALKINECQRIYRLSHDPDRC